jgi:mRNA-degrading endonuclease RelE of RelBE toxin-antitoxin system
MASSEYRLELTTLALGNWIDLPVKTARAAVDERLGQIRKDPRGAGALAEAGRDEYRVRVEDVVIRYAVNDQARLVTVLRIRPV